MCRLSITHESFVAEGTCDCNEPRNTDEIDCTVIEFVVSSFRRHVLDGDIGD